MGQQWDQGRNQTILKQMKMRIQHRESNLKGEIHSITGLYQETRKTQIII